MEGIAGVVALAGITSIGRMAFVNFITDSDFKWFVLGLVSPWVLALALYRAESSSKNVSRP